MIAASLAAALGFALRSGQDLNWDQLNYHLSVPFLLLHGGFWESVAPAGVQSYFNPAVLVPQYLAIEHLSPVLATLALAVPQAIAFMVAGLICREVAEGAALPTLAGFGLCLASPVALSELGTTYVDLVTAVPVLLAFWLLLRSRSWRTAGVAGLLLGSAAGLKLTNLVFLVGVPGCFLFHEEPAHRRLAGVAIVGLAAAVGFALAAGWWHLAVWERFGNPIFPYANGLFHSPDFPLVNNRDGRFLPQSAWDLIRWPIYWMFGGSPTPMLLSPAAEVDPRDARFLLVVLGLPLSVTLAPPRYRGLLVGWCCMYVAWMFGFGIHRYMVALEILTGAVLLALLLAWPAKLRLGAIALTVTLVVIVLHVPNWRRVPFAEHWRSIEAMSVALEQPALVFLADAPTSYVAASLPPGTRFVGLRSEFDLGAGNDTVLTRQIRTLLKAGRVPYVLQIAARPSDQMDLLAGWHLRTGPDCPTVSFGDAAFRLCRLEPTDD